MMATEVLRLREVRNSFVKVECRRGDISSFAESHLEAHSFVPPKPHLPKAFDLTKHAPSPLKDRVSVASGSLTSKVASLGDNCLEVIGSNAPKDNFPGAIVSQEGPMASAAKDTISDREFQVELDKIVEDTFRQLKTMDPNVRRADVIFIFFEMIQLLIEHDSQEKEGRRMEREEFLRRVEAIAANFKDQGSWLLRTAIPATIFDLATGIIPIVGHMKGDWILGKLQGYFSSLKGMDKTTLFKNLSKMANAFSKMQEAIGRIHNMYADGTKARDQGLEQAAKADEEEASQNARQLLQWLGELIQAFLQALRERYDTHSRLNSN